MRLLHVADVHLGAPLGGFGKLARARRERVLDAFRRLPRVAEREGAGAVLLAGDLFDDPRPPDAVVAAVRETVRRLVEADLSVFAVPGNHDAPSLDPGLYEEALPGAVVFREPRFGVPASVDGLHVYGLAFDPAEEPDPLAGFARAPLDGLHVALLHGSVPDAPHWEAGSSLRLPAERLAELDVDYIALGDHHRFRPPSGFAAGTPACYAGSFAAVTLAELGTRGPVLVEVAPGTSPRVRHLSSGVPEVARVEGFDVGSCADEAAVADAVASELPDECVPVVRLEGEPSFPLDAERVRGFLAERFGHAVVEDATRYYDSARLGELARQKTVAGHVARLGLRRLEEAGEEGEAGGAEAGEAAASTDSPTSAESAERRVAERGLRIALRALEVS